jgi:hypothetical protein
MCASAFARRMCALAGRDAVAAAHAQSLPATFVVPAPIAANRYEQANQPVGPGAMDAVDATAAARTLNLCQTGRVQQSPTNPQKNRARRAEDEHETDQVRDGHLREKCANLIIQVGRALESVVSHFASPQRQRCAQTEALKKQEQANRNDQQPNQLELEVAQQLAAAALAMNSSTPDELFLTHDAGFAFLAQNHQQRAGRIGRPGDDRARKKAQQHGHQCGNAQDGAKSG